ncbi:hypothetical protein B5C34_09520 [Pacificimonas flava]|uniref:Uncharacterized protein n=2 Tax=Pacificimonas TaxID=1960290 RepID=A0A219B5P4_9SPHN|nr:MULTISPECIES: hypothetical protein [Pacificimonas]MBZ6379089.1 hypothetical protein [Pacificimonas aurantium]OWV33677.1 hypothetical protein B5C34_09520 [Pacificimonas flava]
MQDLLPLVAGALGVGGLSSIVTAIVARKPSAIEAGTAALVKIIEQLRVQLQDTIELLDAERAARGDDAAAALAERENIRQVLQRMESLIREASDLLRAATEGPVTDEWRQRVDIWVAQQEHAHELKDWPLMAAARFHDIGR